MTRSSPNPRLNTTKKRDEPKATVNEDPFRTLHDEKRANRKQTNANAKDWNSGQNNVDEFQTTTNKQTNEDAKDYSSELDNVDRSQKTTNRLAKPNAVKQLEPATGTARAARSPSQQPNTDPEALLVTSHNLTTRRPEAQSHS